MKRFFLLLLVKSLCADSIDTDTQIKTLTSPLFVSLGSDCSVASNLRNYNLRQIAFPFDWLLTTHEGLIELLNDDFQYFFDKNQIFQHPSHPYIIENAHYQIEFRHEDIFYDLQNDPSCFTKGFPYFQEKYTNRINRFRELKEFDGKVYFFRTAQDVTHGGYNFWWDEKKDFVTAHEAIELRDALRKYFPKLDFTLVIVNIRYNIEVPRYHIEQILFFQTARDYKEILRSLY